MLLPKQNVPGVLNCVRVPLVWSETCICWRQEWSYALIQLIQFNSKLSEPIVLLIVLGHGVCSHPHTQKKQRVNVIVLRISINKPFSQMIPVHIILKQIYNQTTHYLLTGSPDADG